MKWLVRAYNLVLLAYTGWRTFDFMLMQLPSGDLSFWLAIIFLFATELGLLLWHEIGLAHTTTREQHYIATAMTWIDFVGSLAAGIADMILRQTLVAYQVPPTLAQLLIYGLPLLIGGNVAAGLAYLSNDAEAQLERAKRETQYEIFRQAIRDLKNTRGATAQAMKRTVAETLRDEVVGEVENEYRNRRGKVQSLPTMISYNAESPLAGKANGDDGTVAHGKQPVAAEQPNTIITGDAGNPTRQRPG